MEHDPVFATYRGHGWALACGVPVESLLAEVCGSSTGVNAGRGGSAYFNAPDWEFHVENSIVGGGTPIAAGAAMAFQLPRIANSSAIHRRISRSARERGSMCLRSL